MERRRISAAVEERDGRLVVTHFDLAIYCHMLHRLGTINMPVEDVIKIDWGRHEIVFQDPEGKIREVEMQLANNPRIPLADWQAAERSLKSIMRSKVKAPWTERKAGVS